MAVYHITPVAKPRMTQRDKWKKRPCVVKYRKFKDKIRELGVVVEHSGNTVTFMIPMSKSWGKNKKEEFNGKPHQQKPDNDNLLKALLDAIYEDDSCVWDVRIRKFWSYDGAIIVE